jgi:hypothetical protein
MKHLLKAVSKKTGLVAIIAMLVGAGATAGVFAAIPDSNTGIISGCRNTASGALRAIDAQNSETCDSSETPISVASASAIPAPTSAMLRLALDPNNSHKFLMDTGRSRNIVKFDIKDDPDPDNAAAGYQTACLQVAFMPEMTLGSVDNGLVGVGNNETLKFNMTWQASTNQAALDYYCGADYNAFASISSDTPMLGQSILFTK